MGVQNCPSRVFDHYLILFYNPQTSAGELFKKEERLLYRLMATVQTISIACGCVLKFELALVPFIISFIK